MTDRPEPFSLDRLAARVALAGAYADAVRHAIRIARDEGAFTPEPPLDLPAYRTAVDIWSADPPFAALIAAALYRADDGNAALIRAVWPDIAATTQARYDATGGQIEGDR